MASLLERLHLVERVEQEVPDYDMSEIYEEESPHVNIEGVTEGVLQGNLVAEIYNANGLFDMSDSIFKVEEISKSLPATMTTDAKKTSVIGILGSFNLTAEQLIDDASERIDMLLGAEERINETNMSVIDAKKQEIENAKKLIEECEKTIADHEQVISTSVDLIQEEVKRVTALKEFLGGK